MSSTTKALNRQISQEECSLRFKNSPVKRTKRRGMLRHVAIALGN